MKIQDSYECQRVMMLRQSQLHSRIALFCNPEGYSDADFTLRFRDIPSRSLDNTFTQPRSGVIGWGEQKSADG